MRLTRASGLLLHPSSLPSRFGIGDFGPAAHEFVAILGQAGQRWWQILPLGPTGFGNSPYQSYSSFAGNPLLVSPEGLAREGWLSPDAWADFPALPEGHVDFDAVIPAKESLLRLAFARFRPEGTDYEAFLERAADWLDDYSLYMALKEAHGGQAWFEWEPRLRDRELKALAEARERLAEPIRFIKFVQYAFDRQWRELRAACEARGIGLIGDLPIFVAGDSADVWARPDLFWLDDEGRPTVVAGVPPDYFAATGQLWGNPLYRWEAHEDEGYAWWVRRIRAQIERVDLLRLDHFRGFEAYWEVPATEETAMNGRWAPGPGAPFLSAVRDAFGGLPLVAEDLGDISKEVIDLRDAFDLPGMRVVQFGLGGEPGTEFHMPFTFIPHCLAYSGTHDNDTTYGWFSEAPSGTPEERDLHQAKRVFARRFLRSSGEDVHWDVIAATLASVADTVILPLQDLLGLGSAARMNVPGRARGNWGWRFRPGQVRPGIVARLAAMTADYGRWHGPNPKGFGPPRPEPTPAATP